MKPAIRNVFSLCSAIVVQVCGFHEWQAMGDIMDIVKMKGMACQTPEDPVVKMTCLSTMWAGKGIEAVGFAKNQDCVTENITSMAQAGESRRESDQQGLDTHRERQFVPKRQSQDCAAITENMTSLAETKSKARVMVDCSTLDCVVDGMPALNHRCCQKPCGSCIGKKDIMSISGLSKEQAGESQRESDQQDCAAITENMTSLAETKSKARVMVDCSTLDCVVDGMPALNQHCCQKQSCVKEYTKKTGGGQSNLFGCDTWWLWLVISICVVQGCWKWTNGGSVPWGRGWLTMASLVAVAEGFADTWYELSPTGGLSVNYHYAGASVWSTTDNRMYVFGGYTGSYLNALMAYDPQANAWETISPSSGTAPSARTYHTGVWDATNGRMWIFGGSDGSSYNDLHYYDVQANGWVEVSPSGTAITARTRHSAVWDSTNGRMWVFGGYGSSQNDLHYYDVTANQWVEVTPGGTAPARRWEHSAVWDSTNSRMWVFGGNTGGYKNDLHYYDVTANQWVEVTPGGTAPTPRYAHRAEWDDAGGRLWIFAGNDATGLVNDLFYYDLQANAWVEVTPGGVAPDARRFHHSAIDASAGRLYIYGGVTQDGGVSLLYVEIEDQTTTTTVSSSATRTSTSSATRTITTTTSQTISSTTTGTASTTGTTTTTRTGSTTTTASSSTSTSTTTSSSTSTSTTTSSSTSTSTTTSSSTSTSTTTSSSTSTSTTTSSSTITTTTSQTISSTTTGTASTTGTTTTTRTGSTTTTASSSTSTSTTTISRTSTSTTTSSSTSTSTTTSRSASTSSTSSTSSTTTTSITTSTSTSTTSTSTSRSATTSSSSSTTSTTATSTRTSKTMSTTTSSTSTTTTTSTQSSTTTATLTTSTATHTTATDSTTTTSFISSSTTSPTTTTKTGTAIPEGGLTIEELEALEEKRKEEAAQAVAAVEAAENNAVAEAIAAIALQGNGSSSAPGILGEVTISSEAGPVKVAALSLEALGNDSVPVKVSAGETGAELEVSAGLLGEVAAAAGSDVVLLSVAGLPQDAADRLATDDVRAESPDPGPAGAPGAKGPGGARRLASALRSQPLSINFRAADGTKINVNNLTTPMKMTLTVEDPTATCAFWDGATAQWSAKGVQTIPSEIPGILECETTHLSIFGGVVDVALRNVILALECSTVGAVLTPEAMAKMVEDGEWLGRPATLVMLAVAVGFLGLLKLALRSDQRFKETLPWDEREDFLMCVKAKASPQDPRAGAAGAGAADAVEQPPQNEAEQHGKTNDKGADEVQRDRDEQPRENRGDEEVKSEEKEEEEKKDEAAGSLEKLPSIFRTVRGIVEGLLDTISQALGGENVLDSIKEVISNAESGTIHRAIASLQSHRSGADQATVRALQRGDTHKLWVNEEALDADAEGERRRDATSVRIEGSAEDLPMEGEESVPVAEAFGRRQTSAAEIEVQPMNPEDFADRREVSPVHEAAPVRKDGAAEVQGESRCGRRPPPPCLLLQQRAEEKEEEEEEELTQNLRSHDRQPRPRASMIEMIGAAFRAAQRRSAALFAKARAMHGRLAEDGAGAAKRYLESNFFGRVFMLFPAVHNWLKLSQFSIVVPCVIRTELIELKVWSCAFLNAVFFSSTLPPPDSDPACRPESGSVAYWAQKFTVGTVSATVGDFIILLLFLMVRIRIEERDEWTDEDKTERRKWWRNRTIAFWFIAVLYKSFCIFYVCAFIANVSKEDANQLLEATAMSLLQDLVLKPAILALILAVVSTLVLTCRPSIKRNIQAKWMEDRSVEHVAAKDSRGSPIPSEFCEANDVKEAPESLTPAPEPVEPPTLLDIGSSINCFKDWPFHVEEGDGHQPIRPIRPVRDPNEAQFASVLPGMPGP